MDFLTSLILDRRTWRNEDRTKDIPVDLDLAPGTWTFLYTHGNGAVIHRQGRVHELRGSTMALVGDCADYGDSTAMIRPGTIMVALVLDQGADLPIPEAMAACFTTLPMLPAMGESVRSLVLDNPFGGLAASLFQQSRLLELLAYSLHCLGCPLRLEHKRAGHDSLLVQEARDLMEKDLGHVPLLGTLCRELGTNESRLNAAFQKVLGCTPYEHIKSRRLERARELVGETDLAMGTIAEMVGYTSQAHFSVIFQKETGSTPRDYRKMVAQQGRRPVAASA